MYFSLNKLDCLIAYLRTVDVILDLDCGDTTFVNSSGVMTLPTNPTSYLARVNCNYTISTDRTSKISLNVSSFEMRQLIDSYRNCTSEDFKVKMLL